MYMALLSPRTSPLTHFTSLHLTYIQLHTNHVRPLDITTLHITPLISLSIPTWIPLPVTTFLTLFLNVFTLRWKDASKLAGNWFLTHRPFLVMKFPSKHIHVAITQRLWRQMTQCHTKYSYRILQLAIRTKLDLQKFWSELYRVVISCYKCRVTSRRLGHVAQFSYCSYAWWKAEGVKPYMANKIRVL
jgi:hypothetical protein